jgi:hypothetical protein
MAVYKELIETRNVDSTNVATITFTVPQTYDDIEIMSSARENTITGTSYVLNILRFNGDSTSIYSNRRLFANGTNVTSLSDTSATFIFAGSAPTSVPAANSFSNSSILIPGYRRSQFKTVSIDAAVENNAQFAEQYMIAGLWRNTAPITSISIISQITFTQGSTFSIYGIKNV